MATGSLWCKMLEDIDFDGWCEVTAKSMLDAKNRPPEGGRKVGLGCGGRMWADTKTAQVAKWKGRSFERPP